MKSFLLRHFKGTSARRRIMALFLVVALSLTMSVDASAAKAKAKINKTSVSLRAGTTYQLKLTGTKIKSVKTSNKNVATVTKAGKVTAKKAGSATITLNGTNKKAYKCKVTVKNTTINKSAVSLYVGKTYQLKLTGTTINGIKTTNSKVAVVNKKGLVTAKGAGTATITLVGKNKKNHTCKVTVKKTTITPTSKTLFVDETCQLKLTGTTIKSVKSSDSTIAKVTSTGKVTAVKPGTATVTLVGKNGVSHTCKITVDVKHEIEITDKNGLQADGTALKGDQLEVSYGSALGTPKSLTWYADDKAVSVKTPTSEGISRTFVPEKAGEYYAIIINARDEEWTSNKITVVEAEVAAKMSGFTLTEDYETANNITLKNSSTKMVATVTLDRDYYGRFYLVDASKTEYKTGDMVTSGGELSFNSADTTNDFAESEGQLLSKRYAIAEKASDVTEKKTIAGDYAENDPTHQNAVVKAFKIKNKDKSVTYRFLVSTALTRGTNYKLIFDQEGIEEDNITANAPDSTTTPTTASPNITAAVAAPYVKAPKALAVTGITKGTRSSGGETIPTFTAKSKIYMDDNKTELAKWFTTGKTVDGVADTVVASDLVYYANTAYNNTSGTAFSPTASTVNFAAGVHDGNGVNDIASNVCTYAKFTAGAGIFGATALELTSPYRVIPTGNAGTLTVSKGTTDRDVKVTIAGQRSAGTVYLLRKINPDATGAALENSEITAAAEEAIAAFSETDSSTYVARQNVERTAGSVTFTNVVTDILSTARAKGDVYAAVFVPSDDAYAVSETSTYTTAYLLKPVVTTWALTGTVAGPKSAGEGETLGALTSTAGAVVFKDQFGQNITTASQPPFDATNMTASVDTANGVARLAVATNGTVTISITAGRTVALSDYWTLRTSCGTFTLRVTQAGSTGATNAEPSTAEFALTFAAN